MIKMTVNNFVDKAIAVEKLPSLYRLGKFMNSKQGQYLLCDCSGLIKGILWGYPENGRYIHNGVPDMNADTMISRCSQVTNDMSKVQKGWLVWMRGHIGIYIGDGVVIEASPVWENGIQRTYCQDCGVTNVSHLHERKWTKCGQFDQFINYENSKTPKVNVFYRVQTKKHGWLSEVKNLEDYAGYQDSPIIAVAIKVDVGKIKYRVHIKGGSWLGWISDYNIGNMQTGYAGNGKEIDAIQIYYYTPDSIRPYLRAKYKTNYDWQYDTETSSKQDGYAGILGHYVTQLMICIE